MKIIICYENQNYEIEDEDDVCNRIISDPVYATDYVQRRLTPQDSQSADSQMNLTDSQCTASQPEPNQQDTSLQNHDCSEKESSWKHRTVLLFLEECIKYRVELRNPKIRRRTVFSKIKDAMHIKGSMFKESSLEKKLANFKTRYNKIVDNNKKTSTGRGRISWPYFDQMAIIYEDEINVRDAPTVSSLNPETPQAASSGSSATKKEKVMNSASIRLKMVASEEEKVAIARGVLEELQQLRILRQQKFDFEVNKYKENRMD